MDKKNLARVQDRLLAGVSERSQEMVSRLLLQFASLREFQQVTAYADPNPYRIL